MKKIKIFIGFIVLFLLAISTQVLAETAPAKTKPTSKDAISVNTVVLATVNIQNAKIVSQKDNTFNISFSLSNREGVQSGVKYGIELIKDNKYVVDEKIFML